MHSQDWEVRLRLSMFKKQKKTKRKKKKLCIFTLFNKQTVINWPLVDALLHQDVKRKQKAALMPSHVHFYLWKYLFKYTYSKVKVSCEGRSDEIARRLLSVAFMQQRDKDGNFIVLGTSKRKWTDFLTRYSNSGVKSFMRVFFSVQKLQVLSDWVSLGEKKKKKNHWGWPMWKKELQLKIETKDSWNSVASYFGCFLEQQAKLWHVKYCSVSVRVTDLSEGGRTTIFRLFTTRPLRRPGVGPQCEKSQVLYHIVKL